MTDTPPEAAPWASGADVRLVLGALGNRLPAEVNPDDRVDMAQAEAADVLAGVYGSTLPTFTGPGLKVVRWAVAKFAAADILTVLRASLSDSESAAAAELRASALASLAGGVPGFRPPAGSTTTPGGGGGPLPHTGDVLPRVSNLRRTSAFADPYDATIRGVPTVSVLGTPDPADPDVIVIYS